MAEHTTTHEQEAQAEQAVVLQQLMRQHCGHRDHQEGAEAEVVEAEVHLQLIQDRQLRELLGVREEGLREQSRKLAST